MAMSSVSVVTNSLRLNGPDCDTKKPTFQNPIQI